VGLGISIVSLSAVSVEKSLKMRDILETEYGLEATDGHAYEEAVTKTERT
jgi:hypothetical protein